MHLLTDVMNVSLPLCDRCWQMSMLWGGASTFFLKVTAGIVHCSFKQPMSTKELIVGTIMMC